MKLALICPSNLLYMPYVNNYKDFLEENNIEFDIINWDRFGIENSNPLKYRDFKIGHKRNFFDYYRYKNFIVKILCKNKYDKIIIFGLQLTFFLKNFLIKKYKNKYVIDIRDYNKIINLFNIKDIIEGSSFTVISSGGFKSFLPVSDKIIVNHNTQLKDLGEIKNLKNENFESKSKINIACIGAIRDYKINTDFINSLKNKEKINLNFHGEGDINKKIKNYIRKNNILNVNLTGRYKKEEESQIYKDTDIVNVLRYNDGINNRTALPNRLYNSLINGKPMLAFYGTYLSNEIEKYNIGLVVDSFDDIYKNLFNYLKEYDINKFDIGRKNFLKLVIEENDEFLNYIKTFIYE